VRFALPDPDEYPLAGDVLEMEVIEPPHPVLLAVGAWLGAGWFWAERGFWTFLRGARIVLPPVLACSAHLAFWLPASGVRFLVAEIRRRSAA
jgi:hypothetical protein